MPKERRERMAETLKGRVPTVEHRLHLSQALKGRKMSKRELEIHRIAHAKLKGRHHSEESKLKMSKSHKENFTDEMRLQISKRFKGKPKSEETKRKMSESAKKFMSNPEVHKQRSEQIKNSEKYQKGMIKRKGEKIFNNGINFCYLFIKFDRFK